MPNTTSASPGRGLAPESARPFFARRALAASRPVLTDDGALLFVAAGPRGHEPLVSARCALDGRSHAEAA